MNKQREDVAATEQEITFWFAAIFNLIETRRHFERGVSRFS
jgi:hypothetical protein